MTTQPNLTVDHDQRVTLRPSGEWTLANVEVLEGLCEGRLPAEVATIDISQVTALDTIGAWLFEKLVRRFSSASTQTTLVGVSDSYADLMKEMQGINRGRPAAGRRDSVILAFLENVGRGFIAESASFLQMLGAVGVALLGVVRRPRSLRLTSTVYQLYKVGWLAIPIMVLITFLIGAIIAQQGFFHFRKFGAEFLHR